MLGLKVNDVTPKYSRCPLCLEERSAPRSNADRQADAERRRARIAVVLDGAGIPERFKDASFDNYVVTLPAQHHALGVARKYVANWPSMLRTGRSLIFSGGTGTGKTHLGCAVAKAATEQHLAVSLFMPVVAMLRHIMSTYSRTSDRSEKEAIADLVKSPDLLVIDEIGTSTGSDHEKKLLFEVINERYQNLKPTILISNLTVAELDTYLGQRAMDRYRECGSVIAFDWASHRGAPAA